VKRALVGVIGLVVALHWGQAHAAVPAQCGLPDAKPPCAPLEDAARKRAESSLNRTICLRDDLTNAALVSVPTYLRFLAVSS
jgi:hypothetical protein